MCLSSAGVRMFPVSKGSHGRCLNEPCCGPIEYTGFIVFWLDERSRLKRWWSPTALGPPHDAAPLQASVEMRWCGGAVRSCALWGRVHGLLDAQHNPCVTLRAVRTSGLSRAHSHTRTSTRSPVRYVAAKTCLQPFPDGRIVLRIQAG